MKKGILAAAIAMVTSHANADLLITSVFDGPLPGGLPKGIEVYATADIADLSEYGLGSANNGGGSDGEEFVFPAVAITAGTFITIASEDVGFSDFFGYAPNYTGSVASINGDDAIELFYNGSVIDVFGAQDVDGSGTEWDYLDGWAYRKDGAAAADQFNASDWLYSGANALDNQTTNASASSPIPLGSFGGGTTPAPASIIINELDADTEGTDVLEFVELYDGGAGDTDLSALTLVLYNGNGDTSYAAFDLTGQSTNSEGYFVLGNPGVANVDLAIGDGNNLQNGADAVVLVKAPASSFPNGSALPTSDIVDALVYGTNDADDTELLALLNNGQAQVNESAANGSAVDSNQRCENGAGGARNTDHYLQAAPTPGSANNCEPAVAELTLISAIQGTPDTYGSNSYGETDVSPLMNQIVTVEAIVVGDFQNGDADDSRNLNGFYLQEETSDEDGNPASSEGVFVYHSDTDINLGDKVRLTARVDQYYGETQLANVSDLQIIASNALGEITPASISLANNSAVTQGQNGNYQPDLEAYEGMLVRFTDTLTITEQYQLDRFNEVRLIAGERPMQFTQLNAPSVSGLQAHLENLGARSIVYDDGLNEQNASINNLDGFSPYSEATAPRMGDTISNLTGVLDYKWAGNAASGATWRVRANGDDSNQVVSNTSRPSAPSPAGNIKLASLNVLNYFTTLDNGGNTAVGMEPRGANSADELARQQQKLVNTIVQLDADALALVEIENEFDNTNDGSTALETLVNAVNAELGNQTYDYVYPGSQFVGTDAIAVAIIYQTDSLSLAEASTPALLNDSAAASLDVFATRDFNANPIFNGPATNRVALAASFQYVESGERFTLVANHFKSKGSSSLEDSGDINYDQNDGAGFWNQRRLDAATALVNWLDTSPTGIDTDQIAIAGDLNAYAAEAPLQYLLNHGYVNPETASDYSYVFDGQTGTLDYVLLSSTLADKLAGHAIWNINADEADALDYNLDYQRDASYFNGNTAYRSSDHDPLIVGLQLQSQGLTLEELINRFSEMLLSGQLQGNGRWSVIQSINALLYYVTLEKAQWFDNRDRQQQACHFLDKAVKYADGDRNDWITGDGLNQWNSALAGVITAKCD
ncbi:ExeM/NucH family extracellular endonuclease [Gilvimarinus chinensis]|uniref:ExeM/NucH family extracellular endonuclease n=1 Tax=Gilvimarinus chinensis TaxID=396005 RepID=UPI0003673FC1|nr:ExeM/NucH family extracellular endonuclease [Gilvimarinus chinensis]